MNTTQTVALLSGAIHIPLALTVWSMLHRRNARWPLALWVLGSVAMGLGMMAFAARDRLPDWASYPLAAGLIFASMLRTTALRIDLGWPTRARQSGLVWLVCKGLHSLGPGVLSSAVNTMLTLLTTIALTSALAWYAGAAGLRLASRSAIVLALIEALFAAALVLRLLALSMGWPPAAGLSASWDALLVAATAVIAALYGNPGYLGLALDRSSAAARQAQAAQMAESHRRMAAEQSADELRTLLQQRDRLATERNHPLHGLAHEVRQSLRAPDVAGRRSRLRHRSGLGGSARAPARPGAGVLARQPAQRCRPRCGPLDAAAQPVDRGVQQIAVVGQVQARLGHQRVAVHRLAGRAQQAGQHRGVTGAELDHHAVRRQQPAGGFIQPPGGPRRTRTRTCTCTARATVDRPHRQRHLLEAGRLGQVHVGTGADHLVKHIRRQLARNHQHAGLAAPPQQPQQPQQAHAINARQHQVEDVEVKAKGPVAAQQVIAVGKPGHGNAPRLQVLGQVLAERCVVVDQRQGFREGGVHRRVHRHAGLGSDDSRPAGPPAQRQPG